MTTTRGHRLSLSALAAASSFFALSAPALAQSVCTQSGTLLNCLSGTTTNAITLEADTVVTSTPQGVLITDPTTLNLTLGGALGTNTTATALNVTSVGNLTVAAATGGATAITTTGTGSGALLTSTGGTATGTLGAITTNGGYAAIATGATGASLTTGAITDTAVTTAPFTVTGSGGPFNIATPVAANALTGNATLIVNGNLSATSAVNPLVGGLAYAPAGTASATVNGSVTVTDTAGAAVGLTAVGQTGATVTATGPVLVTASGSSLNVDTTGLAAIVTGTGTATVNCGGSVTASGTGALGIDAQGTDVVIACPNSAVTVTGNNSVGVLATATNSINARVGAVSATSATPTGDATAVDLTAPGAITLVSGNLSTNGKNATALHVVGDTGAVSLTTGTVTTTGTISDGIDVTTGTGAITINSGKVTTTGAGIHSVSAGGAQNITVAGVAAGDDAISVTTTGTAPITITATAPVTSTAGFGIRATGGTGTVTVSEAGATGTSGAVSVNNAGNIVFNATGGTTTSATATAVRLASTGLTATTTSTIASGATVRGQGGFDGLSVGGAGGNTVNISGTLTADAGSNALHTTAGAATVNVNSGGVLSGAVLFAGTNDDVITVNSGGTFNPVGTVAFGAGNDTLNVRSGGTLNLGTASALTGLETLSNAGNIGLTGTVSLAGLTTFTNTGTLTATGGATALTGLPTFTNTGTITMVDGAANDSLTLGTALAPTNFVGGANSRLRVDVNTATGTGDQLIVTGNTSGSTVISPSFVGGVVYNPGGATVVSTTGTVAGGSFTLDPGSVAQGYLNAGIRQNGGATQVFTTLDSSVTDLALVRTLGQDMWYQSFDAYNDAVRGRHAGSLTTGNNIGIWGQLYASRDRHGDDGLSVTTAAGNVLNYSGKLRTDRKGAQVGLEYRGPGFVIGATGGYEKAENSEQPAAAFIKGDGHNWGIYALAGMDNGLYAGVLYKRDDNNIRFSNASRGTFATFDNARSEGADGQLGFKGNAGTIGFDLEGGMSWVKTSIGTASAQGLYFRWDNTKSLRGRLGARVFFPQAWGAYLGAKVIHEFNDPADFHVVNVATGLDAAVIDGQKRGTWVRLEGGLDSLGIKGMMLSVWGDVGETKSIGGRVGFRF